MRFLFFIPLMLLQSYRLCAQEISAKEAEELYQLAEKAYQEYDYDNTFKYLLNAAKGGNTKAMRQLAGCYQSGIGTPQNQPEAFKWYTVAAKANNAEAQFVLARYYSEGLEVPKNDSIAAYWVIKAAENNETTAQLQLGLAYLQGQYFTTDVKTGLKWIRKAAELKNIEALHAMGILYYEGVYVDRNIGEAIDWFTKSAELNYGPSMEALGAIFYDGIYVDKDVNQSFMWYKRAAELGMAESQFKTGVMYLLGYSVNVDNNKAAEWFQKAASQGHKKAGEMLTSIEKDRVGKLDTIAFHGMKMAIPKNDVKKNIRELFEITGTVSMNISLEDLKPKDSRTIEVPGSEKQVSELKKITQKEPENHAAWFNLGDAYLKLNNRVEGMKALDKSESVIKGKLAKANEDTLHFWLAMVYMKRELYNDALTQLDIYLQAKPNDELAIFTKLLIYMGQNEIDKLKQEAVNMIAKDPASLNGNIFDGMFKVMSMFNNSYTPEQIKKAKLEDILDDRALKKTVHDNPDNLDLKIVYYAIEQMGMFFKLAQEGMLDSGFVMPAQDADKVTELENFYTETLNDKRLKSRFVIYKFLAATSMFKMDYKKTVEYAHKAMEEKKSEPENSFSSSAEIYDLMIGSHLFQKDTLAAEKTMQEKIANAADQYKIAGDYVLLARYQFHRKDYKAAEKSIKKALELNPNEVKAWYGMAVLYAQANNTGKAFEALKKASPCEEESECKTLEGLIYMLAGDNKSAFTSLKNACIIDKDAELAPKIMQTYFR